MAYYLVKARFHPDLLEELRSRLNSGEIKKMKPFGTSLQYSLENARLLPKEPEMAIWEEEDYCSPPLAQERAAVLDRYFTGLRVERMEEGEGWMRIADLPMLWSHDHKGLALGGGHAL